MKKRYEVVTTVWRIGAYCLKKGDIVELENSVGDEVYVYNVYFGQPVWVKRIDFEIHCAPIN